MTPSLPRTPLQARGLVPARTLDTGMECNPSSAAAHSAAMRVLMMFVLVEAFDLRGEERLWAGWSLDDVCSHLLAVEPHTVPLAARQEMLHGTYSHLLDMRERADVQPEAVFDGGVTTATVDEWADALLAPIQMSYSLDPLTEAHMRSKVTTLLTDLGVGNPHNPRAATHLPTELRHRVLQGRA